MKKIYLLIVITLVLSVSIFPGSKKMLLNSAAKKNLIECLQSDNDGVRKSAIYYSGLYGVNETLIPLMIILHNDNCEEIRILAARALCNIDSERGLYAVKGAASEDESHKVRVACSKFSYCKDKTEYPPDPTNTSDYLAKD